MPGVRRWHRNVYVECGSRQEKEEFVNTVYAVVHLQHGPRVESQGARAVEVAWGAAPSSEEALV